MDSVIDELPKNYFNSSKSKLNRHRNKSKKKSRLSIHNDRKNMKDEDKKRGLWCILIVNLINLVLVASLLSIFLYRKYSVVEEIFCPLGFFGQTCQRNDFIDAISWKSDSDFTTADGICRTGYSFRTWAPGAHHVRLVFKNINDDIFSYYPMTYPL